MKLNRLKLQIPLILLVFFIFTSLALFEWTLRRTLQDQLEVETNLARTLLELVAEDLHLAASREHLIHFRDHLIHLSSHHKLRFALIVDDQGVIQVSQQPEQEGQTWEQVLGQEAPSLVPMLRRSLIPQPPQGKDVVHLEMVEMSLVSVARLFPQPGRLTEGHFLVLVKEQNNLYARVQTKAVQVFLAYLTINLLTTGFLGGLLHWLVTRRLERLVGYMQEVSQGQPSAGPGVLGQDEIGELAQVLARVMNEKTQVEQSMATSHADLTIAQEIGLMGSYTWEQATGLLRWSDQFYRILGYTPGEVPPNAQLWDAALHPDDSPWMLQRRELVMAGRPFVEGVEHRILTRQGNLRYVYHRSRWVEPPQGTRILMGVIQDISQQKLLEHKLERQQELLQQAQTIARLGSWSWHIKTGKVEWSDQVFANLGLDPAQDTASMDLLQSMVVAEDQPRMKAYRQQGFTNPNFDDPAEFRIRTPQGELRQLYGRFKSEWLAGELVQFQGVLQDITQRKNTETALAESRLQLAQARAIAKVGSWNWDPVTGKLDWSDEVFELFGLQPGAIEPSMENWFQLVAEPDRPRLQARLLMLPKSPKESMEVEFTLYQAQGEKRHIYLLARKEPQVGRPPQIGGIMQDITHRKQTEEALQRHKETLETLLDHSPDIITTLDSRNNITYINRTPEGGLGKRKTLSTVFELFHPLVHAQLKEALQKARRGETGELLHKDLENRVWDSRFIPLTQSDDGQEVMIISSDETEVQSTLEHLKAAQAEAERANRAKSEFLANMSHEIRTPLNAILGFSELLGNEPDNPKVRSFSSSIHRAGSHLLSLISDILDLSKIEAEMLEIQPTWVRLGPFFADLEMLYHPQAQKKGLSFVLQAPPLTCLVLLDENRLQQILHQLLDNALQFTAEGEIRLAAQAEQQGQQLNLLLTVQDTGIGISEEQQKDIFTSFYQVSTHQTKRTGGTGLGLTISRRLAQLMGGSLELTSTPGQGSSFRLLLPGLACKDTLLADSPTPRLPQEQRILVVDDLAENRLLLKESLRRFTCEVGEADSGAKALEMLETFNPSLILMDLKMPGMDGVECTTRIKAMPDYRFLPVFAVTASRPDLDWQNATSHLFCEIIYKPVSPKVLLAKLAPYLPTPGPSQAAPEPDLQTLQARDQNALKARLAELGPQLTGLKQLIDLETTARLARELATLALAEEAPFLSRLAKELEKAAATCDIQGILDGLTLLEQLREKLGINQPPSDQG